jgi:putative Ca2+/H+ antiporter (TMEM165/GDT1 family)
MVDPTTAFLTVAGTIFVAELTDKDALLLLTLATKTSAWRVFAAGSIAFTITTSIIVLLGSAIVTVIPISWIKVAGGSIMLVYAVYQYFSGLRQEESLEAKGESIAKSRARSKWVAFMSILGALIVLDLAGDATELITVVFVAQFENILVVFLGAVFALILASGVEAALGNRLGRWLSARKIRYLSVVVFLIIGSTILLSVAVPLS